MTNILVTGAAGFIGSHLTDALLARGHKVVGVDNLALGKKENLKNARKSTNFLLIEEDIASENFPSKFNPGMVIDWVWHMAANSDIPAGVNDPRVDFKDTFMSSFQILEWMRRKHIPRLSFASTSAVYGVRSSAIVEDSGPMFPISNYGAMKLSVEGCISASCESWLKRADIFRFPNVIGSRATHGVIFDFVRKLRSNPSFLEVLGDGNQRKPYLHVSDLIEAMFFIADYAQDKLNYFNIGPEDDISVCQIAAEVVSKVSPGAAIKFGEGARGWIGDVPRVCYSVAKLRELGWMHQSTSQGAVRIAVAEIAAEIR